MAVWVQCQISLASQQRSASWLSCIARTYTRHHRIHHQLPDLSRVPTSLPLLFLNCIMPQAFSLAAAPAHLCDIGCGSSPFSISLNVSVPLALVSTSQRSALPAPSLTCVASYATSSSKVAGVKYSNARFQFLKVSGSLPSRCSAALMTWNVA